MLDADDLIHVCSTTAPRRALTVHPRPSPSPQTLPVTPAKAGVQTATPSAPPPQAATGTRHARLPADPPTASLDPRYWSPLPQRAQLLPPRSIAHGRDRPRRPE